MEFINRDDISFQKVLSRLTKLEKLGLIQKKAKKIKGRRRVFYRIIDADLEEEE